MLGFPLEPFHFMAIPFKYILIITGHKIEKGCDCDLLPSVPARAATQLAVAAALPPG